MDQQQTQQQSDDQQPVQWGPDRRTGKILDEFPLHGEVWCVVQSDEWFERKDLRDADQRYYQREATKQTTPCLLTIRKRDLEPAAPAAEPKRASAGLREDIGSALQRVRDMLQVGLSVEGMRAVERDLMGALAQVGEG